MRFYTRLPGPFAVSGALPTLEDLHLQREAKVAEYYHQYLAYYRLYEDAVGAEDLRKARKMRRKASKYAKKIGPYLPRGDSRWSFEE